MHGRTSDDPPRRASASRRSLASSGFGAIAAQRSRSAERNVPEPDDDGDDDDAVPGRGRSGRGRSGRRQSVDTDYHVDALERFGAERGPEDRLHFRCDSDPLDSAGGRASPATSSERGTVRVPDATGPDLRLTSPPSQDPMPTLPRFPIAETKNRNCWSEPPHSKFRVRGRDYLRERRPSKAPSGPYLLRAIGADLLLTNASSGPATGLASNYPGAMLGGRVRSAPTLVINFVCPWGLIVNYYRIPELYLPFLRAGGGGGAGGREDRPSTRSLEPHERALARFFMGTDETRDSALKLVPVAVEGPLVVKKMVQGKPAIIGRRLPTRYAYYPPDGRRGLADCFEVDLDVNETDSVGKTACNMTRRYTSSVTVDLGFVIEGRKEDELPERMLGCVRLHRLDALMAPTLPGL